MGLQNNNTFNIQEELKKLPEKPGVYIMKDEDEKIIYIGKAVVLKNRVRQYFQSISNMSPKTKVLVSKIREFEYIITDTELEALILECNLIKKHKPKFNILLKDDKTYPYIKVTTNEEFPRVFVTRKLEKDGAKYFGPFSNATAVRDTLELLKKLFPIKTCSKVITKDKKARPCLNFHISQCLGPCMGDANQDEYRDMIKKVCSFLGGRQDEVLAILQTEMIKASENLDFEKAAVLRDKISSVKYIAEKQKVLSTAMGDQDVIAFAKGKIDACIQVFFIRMGKLIGNKEFVIKDACDVESGELLSSFVKQFYDGATFIPEEIFLQENVDELNVIEKWLSDKRETKVHIKVPKKGDKLRLVEMVAQNAVAFLRKYEDKSESLVKTTSESLQNLAELLKLSDIPERIEAYDISNTGSTEIVGSMAVFVNAQPSRKDYRRFKIKSIDGQNDYASMQEMLFRRFKHGAKEEEEINNGINRDINFSNFPDLVLVDGGLGHVNSIKEVLKQLGIGIPLCGMVKDSNHRTRGIMTIDGEIDLSKYPKALKLVTQIQDEAHRFAVEYNRKLREKRYRKSVLDDIDGIGDKRKKGLLKHFGSISRIKSASLEELMRVEGMNRSSAEKVYDFFR